MADHYFTNRPTIAHDEKDFSFELRGRSFRFRSDAGVFSKERIDYGSVLLIDEMEIAETDHVLDMGCGYGPIGITAASLATKGKVLMVDVNERAVALAKHNVAVNQISNAEVIVSDLFQQIDPARKFTVILTNPPIRAGKETVHTIFEKAMPFLQPNGALWVVIQKKQGAPSAFKKLEELFRNVSKVTQDKGYWIIKAVK